MAGDRARIIQVGAGGFGHSWHRAVAENNCEVVGLVDADPEALAEAGEHFGLAGGACFGPGDEWHAVEADMIIDSTPHPHHLRNAALAFAGGQDVLVVKPMALEEPECQAMVRLAEQSGRKLAVAQQLRFHPLIMELRGLLQKNAIGQLGFVHLDWFRAIPDPQDAPLFCQRGWTQPYPMLVEGAIHLFDYLRWATGYEPASVWGQSFNLPWSIPAGYGLAEAPQTCAYAEFEMRHKDVDGPLHVCFRSMPTRLRRDSWLSHWEVEGTEGTIAVQNDRILLDGDEVAVSWEDGASISDLRLDRLNSIVLGEFLAWRDGGPEPGFSGRNNLPSTAMAFGVLRSWQSGARVTIAAP